MTDGIGTEQPAPRRRVLESVRGAAATGLELLTNRIELFGVEVAEERARLIALLSYGAIALMALGVGLVFLSLFITVLLWDSHRLLVLGVFSSLFILGGGLALRLALAHARRPSALFAASLGELRKDREALRPES